MKYILFFSRVIVGLLFIFSGLIKANDPLGFGYKLEEYFEIFGLDFLNDASVYISMFICIFEVFVGIAVIFAIQIKAVSWSLLLMILFFTWLTGYSAITGKVTDCGCFGDAIKLTPWQSFYKDVILLILIGIIFVKRNTIIQTVKGRMEIGILASSFILVTWFTLYCYNHLPVIDFRPYAIGKSIPEQMEFPPDVPVDKYEVIYTLENKQTNELIKVSTEDYISQELWKDANLQITQTSDPVLIQEGYRPPISDLSIVDASGTDLTDMILNNPEFNFILVAYDLGKTNNDHSKQISDFYATVREFVALTASTSEINSFVSNNNLPFQFYNADETVLKTMIRSNPGLILLKNGIILNKWHYNDFPLFEESLPN